MPSQRITPSPPLLITFGDVPFVDVCHAFISVYMSSHLEYFDKSEATLINGSPYIILNCVSEAYFSKELNCLIITV